MNLALPALILLFLALPGYLCVYAYNGRLNQHDVAIGDPITYNSLVSALVLSVLIHVFWVTIARHITDLEIDFHALAFLLAGDYSDTTHLLSASSAVFGYSGNVLFCFSTILVASLLLGAIARAIVLKLRLDAQFGLLRFNNEWHYLFSGELADDERPDFTAISATIELGGQVTLYVGILVSYSFFRDGRLEKVVLIAARRRQMFDGWPDDEDRIPSPFSDNERYYDIEGEFFILHCKDVKTLNVDYMYIVDEDEERSEDEDGNSDLEDEINSRESSSPSPT